jgi:hypothetical protein
MQDILIQGQGARDYILFFLTTIVTIGHISQHNL